MNMSEVVLMLILLSLSAAANMAPPEVRALDYTFVIDNLADYPDHVLLIYPTTNNGFAYVVEAGKGLTGLMIRADWRSEGTALYAMTRADFEAHAPEPSVYGHGDEGVMVTVVPQPPSSALRAERDIQPPERIWESDPERGLIRIVHIETLDETTFTLGLISEETVYADGNTESAIAPDLIPGIVPPKQTRCGTVAGAGGLVAITLALLGLSRRRDPVSSRPMCRTTCWSPRTYTETR